MQRETLPLLRSYFDIESQELDVHKYVSEQAKYHRQFKACQKRLAEENTWVPVTNLIRGFITPS
jgi:hypothetical protein